MSYIDMPQSSVNVYECLQEITNVLLRFIHEKEMAMEHITLDFDNNSMRLYFADASCNSDPEFVMDTSSINIQENLQEITEALLHIMNDKRLAIDKVELDFKNNALRLYFDADDEDSEYSDETC